MNSQFATDLLSSLQKNMGDLLPSVLGALVILVIGWLIALVLSTIVRRSLAALSRRTGDGDGGTSSLGNGLAKGVFWIVMLFTVIAAFNNLKLASLPGPLSNTLNQALNYLPKLIAGGVLLLVGWLVATVVKLFSTRALAATSLDSKLSVTSGTSSLSGNIGNLLFWLVFLLFIPAILGALQMEGLLRPVQEMVQKILNMLPNIFGAAVIGGVGWLIAKILRNLTSSVLATAGADNIGYRLGFKSDTSLSSFAGSLVFLLVFIPALIAALNALGIEAIARPATDMLHKLMDAIPNLLAAAALLGITYYVGRFVAMSLAMLLRNLGFDNLPNRLGLTATSNDLQLSALVGQGVLFFIMLFATVEAADMLGFHQVRDVVTMFIRFAGQVLLGAVILAIGFWLANLAHASVLRVAGSGSIGAANLARFAILGLVTAMGLRAMGIADDIVNLAFGLTLGAVAVAAALSFGLGGREAAGKLMDRWLSRLR